MAISSTPEHSLIGSTTEGIDPRYAQFDQFTTTKMVAAMNEAEAEVPRAIKAVVPAIAAAIDDIAPRMAAGGRLIYVGAGTPGRLGVLDASECPPTFSADPSQVVGLIAGGSIALTTAVEGAEDDRQAGERDAADLGLGPNDTVVGLTASGRTPYVMGAVDAAHAAGALTVGVVSNAESPLSAMVDHAIEVIVGPEVIAGSTRLKAGSAQKQVLNMLSTLTMVKLGKTYGNLMVDVSATNKKLMERAQRLVCELTGVSPDEARQALAACDNKVKCAVVSIIRGVDAATARNILDKTNGFLRPAISPSA